MDLSVTNWKQSCIRTRKKWAVEDALKLTTSQKEVQMWHLSIVTLLIQFLHASNQTWTYCSTILLGPISWPFYSINPKSFIGIGIVWSFTFWSFNFVTVLLLLVFKTLNIGLYKVYFWYCIGIVLLYGNIYLGNSVSGKNSKHLKTKQF